MPPEVVVDGAVRIAEFTAVVVLAAGIPHTFHVVRAVVLKRRLRRVLGREAADRVIRAALAFHPRV